MEQKSSLEQAQYYHIIGQYDSALALYTEIQKTSQTYELYIAKAIAYIGLNNIESAFQDLDHAIKLNPEQYEAYYRRGQCFFYNAKFSEAIQDFERVNELIVKNPVLNKKVLAWIGKAQAEQNNVNMQGLIEQGGIKQPICTKQLQKEAPAKPLVVEKQNKINYTWYQTDKVVGIEIGYSLSDPKSLTVEADEQSLSVSFPTSSSSSYDLSLTLFDKIVVDTKKVEVLNQMIKITLEKQTQNKNWDSLVANQKIENLVIESGDKKMEIEKKSQSQEGPKKVVDPQQKPYYPSSSKVKKNWDQIGQEIDEDVKKNAADYGEGDALNGLFKQIYANADENTKKAMVKSFQTSGGTVLSTNWGEVEGKDYEGKDRPSPPKGQKWGKWEK